VAVTKESLGYVMFAVLPIPTQGYFKGIRARDGNFSSPQQKENGSIVN
jgi:hypothetical protein